MKRAVVHCGDDSASKIFGLTALEHHHNYDMELASPGQPVNTAGSAETYRCLIRKDGTKVGEFIVTLSNDRRSLTLNELFIEPEYRGKGVGREALSFVDALASNAGVQKVVVDPCPVEGSKLDEEGLRRWYARNGYNPCAKRFYPRSRLLAKEL